MPNPDGKLSVTACDGQCFGETGQTTHDRGLRIGLLAFLVIAVLAMVVFGVITVGEVKEFDVFRPPRFNRFG